MRAEQQEVVGRVYDRLEDAQEERVVFNRSPSLIGVMDVAHLEFPGTRFELLVLKASKEGKVSLVRKHGKPKLF